MFTQLQKLWIYVIYLLIIANFLDHYTTTDQSD